MVSIDAAGTQTAIAERILEGNAHYFPAVKDNQPSLREAVRYAFRCGSVTDTSSEMETGHGRVEERVCRIASADSMEDEAVLSRWPGVRTVVDVTFKEDACRARKGFAAQNLSTVRKMALQIVKAHSDNRSIRKRLFRASLSQDYLLELLRGARI